MTHADDYIGPMGHTSRLDLYDPGIRLALRERRFKRRLLAMAKLRPGFRVLDLGCGTGTLAIMAMRSEPGISVVGIDGFPAAIEIARGKAARNGVAIEFHLGLAQQLPYRDRCFDRVLSTLTFHHLTRQGKIEALAEIVRVLKTGGELHVADFGRPANLLMRAAFSLVRRFDGVETTEDNVEGRLPDMIEEAGLENVRETGSYSTIVGTIRLYSASRPLENRPG